MSTEKRNDVRREVLSYLGKRDSPVQMSNMANDLRSQNEGLKDLQDSDFRSVVQPMIATGKLNYAPGLKITLGKASK